MSIVTFLAGALAPPFGAAFWCVLSPRLGPRWKLFRVRGGFLREWIWTAFACAGFWLVTRHLGWAAGATLSGTVAVVFWWLSRRRRKRAPKAAGAKSRLRIAALVRSMREARPALRPVPQGAR